MLSRRTTLLGLGASAGLAACAGTSINPAQASRKAINWADREENVSAYLRIISDLSERPTWRYQTGLILAVPKPHHLGKPFLQYYSIKQDRVRHIGEGTYQHAYRGVTLFADPVSGKILDTFDNPLTGKTNTVKHYKTSKGSIVYSPEGVYFLRVGGDPVNMIPESEKPFRLGHSTVGDDVWVTYDERFQIDDADGNLLYADNSMYRYMTRLDQLEDRSRTSVDTAMNWQTETKFWEWMDMKDHPGHLIFGSMGKKYADASVLPPDILAAAEKYLPGHLSDEIIWSEYKI